MTADHGQYGDRRPQRQHREHPSHGEGLPVGTTGGVFPSGGGGGGPEAVDAVYRAVVDAASRGVHVTVAAAVEPEKPKTLTHDLEAFEPPRDTGRRAN
ncbi:hypothetical protein CRUP_032769 [Coryphaenoides rupestris]|nr:hypothetical protein CRUP_032769 [Coryphaenoides rupestris]